MFSRDTNKVLEILKEITVYTDSETYMIGETLCSRSNVGISESL